MPATLVLLSGPAAVMGKQWPLTEQRSIVGRAVGAEVEIPDPSVSKQHAAIATLYDAVGIVDLSSTNQTSVNGAVLKPGTMHQLRDHDQIKVGNVLLKFLAPGNIEAVSAKEVFDLARTDPLTGVKNKGALLTEAPRAVERAQQLGAPLVVSIYDLDHFKAVNDTYGHDAGDKVLQQSARLLGEQMGALDFLARFGGEEFVVLHSDATPAEVVERAEQVRRAIETAEFRHNGQVLRLTVSVGIAALGPVTPDWESLFQEADRALYAAKHGGRNRVVVAGD